MYAPHAVGNGQPGSGGYFWANKSRMNEPLMNDTAIRDRLVERGYALLHEPKESLIQFAKVSEADILLNDLTETPHAFVLACVMDRQIKAEKAWIIPYLISQKLGDFSIEKLTELSRENVKELMSRPEPLHRFVDKMNTYFYAAVQRIADQYKGDAARIWSGRSIECRSRLSLSRI